ncbi:MAG: hypothetical protein DPW18_08495 [Chloroflexi bacterium]|nr:hypothetical protein [Chloroflexota bacterium]MDL1941813.1 pilus assembly protein [Chloroflexi bacterium CFX2]
MRKMLERVFSFLRLNKKTRLPTRKGWHKPRAQSLVEFAITLPIILILLSGMIEFGFLLNTYLSIQDAARTTARRYSTTNPYNPDGTDNPVFYQDTAQYIVELLAPSGDPASRQIAMDPTRDNILVSLIGIEVDESTTPDSIATITRHSGGLYYKHYSDTDPPTAYSDERIEELMTANGAEPSDAGLLIIEIYYSYEGTLNLPWTLPFFSPSRPSMLYISVVMPTIYAKPLDSTTP